MLLVVKCKKWEKRNCDQLVDILHEFVAFFSDKVFAGLFTQLLLVDLEIAVAIHGVGVRIREIIGVELFLYQRDVEILH